MLYNKQVILIPQINDYISNFYNYLCTFCRSKVSVICDKTVKVTNEGQPIVWEDYGLRLHIPPNSLPEGCSELQLTMTVSRATDCGLRDKGGNLVSAVYSFSHNLEERNLRQKATLEMQHCAQGSYIPLCIVQSDSLVPPHKFQSLEGGKFDSSDRYASIELDHFCSFGVYLAWVFHRNLSTRATLYYTNITPRSFHFLLYICPDLDAIIRVCCNLLLFIILVYISLYYYRLSQRMFKKKTTILIKGARHILSLKKIHNTFDLTYNKLRSQGGP